MIGGNFFTMIGIIICDFKRGDLNFRKTCVIKYQPTRSTKSNLRFFYNFAWLQPSGIKCQDMKNSFVTTVIYTDFNLTFINQTHQKIKIIFLTDLRGFKSFRAKNCVAILDGL